MGQKIRFFNDPFTFSFQPPDRKNKLLDVNQEYLDTKKLGLMR